MGRWRAPEQPGSPYITPEGARALRAEHQLLWREKRPEVVRALSEAAAEGEVSLRDQHGPTDPDGGPGESYGRRRQAQLRYDSGDRIDRARHILPSPNVQHGASSNGKVPHGMGPLPAH